MVAVASNPGVDGFSVFGNLGFRILVQLRFVSMQAKQLCHKKYLACIRRYLHPHTGVNIKLLVCLAALLRRLRLRLLMEKIK